MGIKRVANKVYSVRKIEIDVLCIFICENEDRNFGKPLEFEPWTVDIQSCVETTRTISAPVLETV